MFLWRTILQEFYATIARIMILHFSIKNHKYNKPSITKQRTFSFFVPDNLAVAQKINLQANFMVLNDNHLFEKKAILFLNLV